MPFTDRSDLFGSIDEGGVNRFIRHVVLQRPSLFNYATEFFNDNPGLLCKKIPLHARVEAAGDPLFSVEDPLPVLGTTPPIGLNWCLQITDVQVDFHPSNVIDLPRELGKLPEQHLAFRFKACFGLDCLSDDMIEELLPGIEATAAAAAGHRDDPKNPDTGAPRPTTPFVPRTRELLCTCLELYATAHVEWGTIPGVTGDVLKPKLDGLEIVDLKPDSLESQIECFLRTTVRLGLLPMLNTPIESLVLDITGLLAERGFTLGQSVRLEPTPAPADVPFNPAIEDDQLKAFVSLVVEDI